LSSASAFATAARVVDRLPADRLQAELAEIRHDRVVPGRGRIDEISLHGDLEPALRARLIVLFAGDRDVVRRQWKTGIGFPRLF
jgi:hypothetical protein